MRMQYTFIACMHWLAFEVTLAAGVGCSGSFTNDAAANHFTADCAAALVAGSRCALTFEPGYVAGSVMCSVTDGVTPRAFAYVARASIKLHGQHHFVVPARHLRPPAPAHRHTAYLFSIQFPYGVSTLITPGALSEMAFRL
jgi:hypothetical protein